MISSNSIHVHLACQDFIAKLLMRFTDMPCEYKEIENTLTLQSWYYNHWKCKDIRLCSQTIKMIVWTVDEVVNIIDIDNALNNFSRERTSRCYFVKKKYPLTYYRLNVLKIGKYYWHIIKFKKCLILYYVIIFFITWSRHAVTFADGSYLYYFSYVKGRCSLSPRVYILISLISF